MTLGHERHRRLWIGIIAAFLTIAMIAWVVAGRRRAAVLAFLPPVPDLSDRHPRLQERISVADRRATGWLDPLGGMAELARLYQANGDYEEAMQCLAGLETLDSTEPRWWHLHAVILAQFGRLEEAISLWQRAAALGTDYLPVYVRLGESLLKSNRIDEAKAAFDQGLNLAPDNEYALLGKARCAIVEGDWQKARQMLARALEIDPEFVGALTLLVTVYEHLGASDAADALRVEVGMREFVDIADPWLSSLMEDCYDAYRVSVAAAVARLAGEVDRAQRLLERAVALAPGAAAYRRQLGKLLLQRDDYAGGRRHLERAVELDPTDTAAWSLLIELFEAQKDYRALDRAIAAGLAASPKSMALHLAQGRRLAAQGRLGEAIQELRLAKSLKPDEVRPYLELAMIYFQLERIDEGVAEMKAALRIDPENPLALGVVARAAVHAGNRSEADVWLNRIQRQPRFPEGDLRAILEEYRAAFGRTR